MKNLSRLLNIIEKIFFLLQKYDCKISLSSKIFNSGIFYIGKKVSIEKNCIFRIKKNARLEISDNVFIGKDSEISVNNTIKIGENTSIQSRANIFGDVKIFSNCIIGPNLYASSFSHEFFKNPTDLIINQDKLIKNSKPIIINEDCFIGINVFIKPGVVIGRGCIIGANSNIIDDLQPYSVVVGNPANLLKKRLEFFFKNKINSNKIEDLPYFYRGFKKNYNNKLIVNEENFVLALNILKKQKITMEVFSNFSSSLFFKNKNTKKKFQKGKTVLSFDINYQKNQFLEFKINDFRKNRIFEITAVKTT